MYTIVNVHNGNEVMTPEFTEDEIKRYAEIWNGVRKAQGYKYQYGIMDMDTREIVGWVTRPN